LRYYGIGSREIRMAAIPHAPQVEAFKLHPDGKMPNNQHLPLLVYRGVLSLDGDPAGACEKLFAQHGWTGAWRNGIYDYDHFHATMHEVLGIVRGQVKARFGGEGGVEAELGAGDVVVIPAGVAHRNLGASQDLLVVGAYPGGGDGDEDIHTKKDRAAAQAEHVPVPGADPVFGRDGPLRERWRS
jgi:uncharacterized protein YjlB